LPHGAQAPTDKHKPNNKKTTSEEPDEV